MESSAAIRHGIEDGAAGAGVARNSPSASSASRTRKRSSKASAASCASACHPTPRPNSFHMALRTPCNCPSARRRSTRARRALAEEWGKEPVLAGCGGSIPIVGAFKRDLEHGLADDRLRASTTTASIRRTRNIPTRRSTRERAPGRACCTRWRRRNKLCYIEPVQLRPIFDRTFCMGARNAFFSRDLLGLSAALTSAASLSGCDLLMGGIEPWCSNDPRISDPSVPLAIDSHVHVFNGSDLQVDAFLTRARHIEGLGPILQKLAWEGAPIGDQELEELVRVADTLKACDRHRADWLKSRGDHQYEVGLQALNDAADQLKNENAFLRAETSEVVRQIRNLPKSYSQYKDKNSPSAFRFDPVSAAIEGALAFILRNFQFRYVNVFDCLFEYSKGRRRKIDLMVCHLVDYDWPIAGAVSKHVPQLQNR